jgi:glycine hydroxymethyltransferase
VVKNAQTLASELSGLGYRIVTGGTDNHIVLIDMSGVKLSGAKAERILELVEISVNKNTGVNVRSYIFHSFVVSKNYSRVHIIQTYSFPNNH